MPAALLNSCRRVVSRRILPDDVAPGWAPPPSLTDTTRTGTPDATSCAIVAPKPRVSSSGCAATTTRPGHSVEHRQGRQGCPIKGGHPHRCWGTAAGQRPSRKPGAVAYRYGPQVIPRAQPAARARPGPARRGFVVCRCSSRLPAEHAGRPDTTGPAPTRGRCG